MKRVFCSLTLITFLFLLPLAEIRTMYFPPLERLESLIWVPANYSALILAAGMVAIFMKLANIRDRIEPDSKGVGIMTLAAGGYVVTWLIFGGMLAYIMVAFGIDNLPVLIASAGALSKMSDPILYGFEALLLLGAISFLVNLNDQTE